jgi:peroxiredoxin
MPNKGEKAPDFRLLGDDGKEVSLAALYRKNVILFFFPKALTPG